MDDGFFPACIASIVLSGLCMYVFSDLKKPVIGYAGAQANIKVYRCPGYDDVVTERDWQGPRTVEKQ